MFKRHMFTNLNKISKENIKNQQYKLWKRQTSTNLRNFLGNFKNENVPKNYKTLVNREIPFTHFIWSVVDPRTGRKNWFMPSELRRMVISGPSETNAQRAWLAGHGTPQQTIRMKKENKNNYGIFTAAPYVTLFMGPMTQSPIQRKNVTLAKRV